MSEDHLLAMQAALKGLVSNLERLGDFDAHAPFTRSLAHALLVVMGELIELKRQTVVEPHL